MPGKREVYIEETARGRKQFVMKRANSHREHGRHEETVKMTRSEWELLLERERNLRETTDSLSRENHALKSNLQAYEGEVRHLRHVVPQLQGQVRQLDHENRELRRSLDSGASGAEDQLRHQRHKNARLKNENETLLQRVRALEGQLREGVNDRVRQLVEEVRSWRRRAEDLQVSCSRVQGRLDVANERIRELEVSGRRLGEENATLAREDHRLREKVRVYEGILRRHGYL